MLDTLGGPEYSLGYIGKWRAFAEVDGDELGSLLDAMEKLDEAIGVIEEDVNGLAQDPAEELVPDGAKTKRSKRKLKKK